jgi:hypothetical protein
VDQVDEAGRYVFPREPGYKAAVAGLDENDELSFMACDAGDRMGPGRRPLGVERGVEIEIIDPLDNGRAWLYLFEQPGGPTPALPDYVDYHNDGIMVSYQSDRFLMGNFLEHYGYDTIRMITRDGEIGPDVLDQQRIGIELEVISDVSMSMSVPQTLMKFKHIGVIDGPVRLIVDEVVMFNVGEFSLQYGAENFNRYYRCGQNNAVNFTFPMALNQLFRSFLFYWGLDFTPEIVGSYYIDPNRKSAIRIKDEEKMEVPADAPHFWWGLYGPQGAVLQAVKLDEYALEYVDCDGRWRQKPRPVIHRGDVPGKIEIGLNCHEKEKVPEKSEYQWENYIIFPKDPSPEGLQELRNIFENPLEISVREIELR